MCPEARRPGHIGIPGPPSLSRVAQVGCPPPLPADVADTPAVRPSSVQELSPARIRWGRVPEQANKEVPAGVSRGHDLHRGQELPHGQLRAPLLAGTAAALGGPAMRPNRPGAGGCPDTTSPGGGVLHRPSSHVFSPGTGPKCAPKLADRAVSPFLALRRSRVAHGRLSSATTGRCRGAHPRRSGCRRFKSCLRLASDTKECPNKEVRVDSTLAPDYNLT